MTDIIVYHQTRHYLAVADEKTLIEKRAWLNYADQTKSHYGTYSGYGKAKNVPFLEGLKEDKAKGIHGGVIPAGLYKLEKWGHHVASFAFVLTPQFTVSSARGDFRMHGDYSDKKKWGTASEGCIITPQQVRLAIHATGIKYLLVVRH